MLRSSTVRLAALVGALAIVLLSCSSSNSADQNPSPDSTTTSIVLGNPGTLVPPTTEPPEKVIEDLPVTEVVAFLDACVADAELFGPCHCAADRLNVSFTSEDIKIFEDRITGQLEYPPQVAADLVSCADAEPPPAWETSARQAYVEACAKGSNQLEDLCTCSLDRAQQIVPVDRLQEFIDAGPLVRPDFAALINLCL